MKEIFKITLSLTCICIAAALILGAVYTQTEHIRKKQEEKETKETIESLLGFGSEKEAPEDLHVYSVFRYVITTPEKKNPPRLCPACKGQGTRARGDRAFGHPGTGDPHQGRRCRAGREGYPGQDRHGCASRGKQRRLCANLVRGQPRGKRGWDT